MATPNEKLTAMRDLGDRALGKPSRTTAEVGLPSETEQDIAAMTPQQRRELLRRLKSSKSSPHAVRAGYSCLT